MRREYPTAIGPVDLLCRDAGGGAVAVEIKRRGEIDGVEQLTRYLDLLNRDPLLAPVRGVFAAQEIKPQARVAGHRPRHRLRDPRLRRAARRGRHGVPALLTGAHSPCDRLAVVPGQDGPVAISARGVRKSYGAFEAVKGIDLEVRTGEIFALLGPNGAGKTTTVEILEGYRDRTGGDVSVLGQDPGQATRLWRSRIGIVLQSTNDNADLSVDEVVRHFATFYPAPRDPDAVIAAVGLTEKSSSRVRDLSGGQRRRLDVALGILGNAELLFLDEPTTGFDPEARRQFWDLIDSLRADGTTILLTTHYLEEAERLADRVGVIAGGRIVEVGEPETLGGRQEAPTTVTWLEDGTRHSLSTREPTRVVTELGLRFGGEVPELAVLRPTLEDIYLQMIGAAEQAAASTQAGAAERAEVSP